MSAHKKPITPAIVLFAMCISLTTIPTADAASYNFTYHTGPSDQDCHWVYRWKRVYGKRIKVKVRVCN